MKVLIPGHLYELDNLKSKGTTVLKFYMDPKIHEGKGHAGPSTQEVMRAVIDRVQVLDSEKPWPGNAEIIKKAREIIAIFEMRALYFKVAKGELDIEKFPTGPDGHLQFVERA